MISHLHHVLLLREVAVELEILFRRSLFRSEAKHGLLLQLAMSWAEMAVEVANELAGICRGRETDIHRAGSRGRWASMLDTCSPAHCYKPPIRYIDFSVVMNIGTVLHTTAQQNKKGRDGQSYHSGSPE